jgi:hypothetical protein
VKELTALRELCRDTHAQPAGFQCGRAQRLHVLDRQAVHIREPGVAPAKSLRPNNNGRGSKLDGNIESRLTRYFNTSAFSHPAPFTFGNMGRTLPHVRGPGANNRRLSIC